MIVKGSTSPDTATAVKEDGTLSGDKTPSPTGTQAVQAPDPKALPKDPGPETGLAASAIGSKAERIWHGQQHRQEVAGARQVDDPGEAALAPASAGVRAGTIVPTGAEATPGQAAAMARALIGPLTQMAEKAEHVLLPEGNLVSLAWPLTPQAVSGGAPAIAAMPSGAVPHLAAGLLAALHARPDGTTEIALSPDELGSVRLRLETDPRDPDRVIVHLAFDRPETMDLFRRHADQLSDAMRAAGYAETRLDFGQQGAGAETDGRPDHAGQQGDPAAVSSDGAPGRELVRQIPETHQRRAGMAGLDLRL
jgi:hypothetical protein